MRPYRTKPRCGILQKNAEITPVVQPSVSKHNGHSTKRSKMQDRAVKEGFQPLKKASTMPTSPRAPPAPPSVDELRIGDLADLRAQDLSKLYTFAEDREEIYISRLREAVAIKGVSAWVENRPKIVEMLEWAKAWAERLGAAEARFVENPKKARTRRCRLCC